jgi:hypothetical protein
MLLNVTFIQWFRSVTSVLQLRSMSYALVFHVSMVSEFIQRHHVQLRTTLGSQGEVAVLSARQLPHSDNEFLFQATMRMILLQRDQLLPWKHILEDLFDRHTTRAQCQDIARYELMAMILGCLDANNHFDLLDQIVPLLPVSPEISTQNQVANCGRFSSHQLEVLQMIDRLELLQLISENWQLYHVHHSTCLGTEDGILKLADQLMSLCRDYCGMLNVLRPCLYSLIQLECLTGKVTQSLYTCLLTLWDNWNFSTSFLDHCISMLHRLDTCFVLTNESK